MIPLQLREIAEVTGGTLNEHADPGAVVGGYVEFDSRKVAEGGLFVALSGARADGHDFASAAVDQGAVAVLAARDVDAPAIIAPAAQTRADDNSDLAANDKDGSVAAVVGAMSRLAAHVARELTSHHGLSITGVTGSAGKTSTKDLIAAVLSTAGETVAPPDRSTTRSATPTRCCAARPPRTSSSRRCPRAESATSHTLRR